MKKVSLLFCVLSMLLCISCSSDDDFEITPKNIIGHWESVTSSGYSLNLNTGEKTDYEEKPYTSLSFKLYEDGTCVRRSSKGTYKLLGKELDMYVSYYNSTIGREVSSTYNYTIEELASDRMVLSSIDHGYDIDSEGNTINWEWKTVYTMKKVSN